MQELSFFYSGFYEYSVSLKEILCLPKKRLPMEDFPPACDLYFQYFCFDFYNFFLVWTNTFTCQKDYFLWFGVLYWKTSQIEFKIITFAVLFLFYVKESKFYHGGLFICVMENDTFFFYKYWFTLHEID